MATPRVFFNDLFPHVAMCSGPVVYVVEFSNGALKIGHTGCARARMFAVKSHARRIFGHVDLVRVHVTEVQRVADVTKHAERATLCAVSRVIAPVAGTDEFFVGFPFEKAVSIADSAIVMAQRYQRSLRRERRARERQQLSQASPSLPLSIQSL